MKKSIFVLMTLTIIFFPLLSYAINYSILPDEELLTEFEQIQDEMVVRGLNQDRERYFSFNRFIM